MAPRLDNNEHSMASGRSSLCSLERSPVHPLHRPGRHLWGDDEPFEKTQERHSSFDHALSLQAFRVHGSSRKSILEEEIVALKLELAQAKSDVESNRHVAIRLAKENKKLRDDIEDFRTREKKNAKYIEELGEELQKINKAKGPRWFSSLRWEIEPPAKEQQVVGSSKDLREYNTDETHNCRNKNLDGTESLEAESYRIRHLSTEVDRLKLDIAQSERENTKISTERDELKERIDAMMKVHVPISNQPGLEDSAKGSLRNIFARRPHSKYVASPVVEKTVGVDPETLLWNISITRPETPSE